MWTGPLSGAEVAEQFNSSGLFFCAITTVGAVCIAIPGSISTLAENKKNVLV
jgi:hypothetical protein